MSLDIEPTDQEIRALEASYTRRYDFHGISDDNELQAILARIPQFTTVTYTHSSAGTCHQCPVRRRAPPE
jgi:hypothetical protein